MEDVNKKIQKAKKLQDDIAQLKNFINLCNNGHQYSEQHKGQNKFRSLTVSADIWTGSQNPNYKESILNHDTIKLIIIATELLLKDRLKEQEDELTSMFK